MSERAISKDDLIMVKSALESGAKLINEGNAIISFAKGLIANKYKLTDDVELDIDSGVIKSKKAAQLDLLKGDEG